MGGMCLTEKKIRVRLRFTVKMRNHILENTPEHMTNSVWLEDLYWKYVKEHPEEFNFESDQLGPLN